MFKFLFSVFDTNSALSLCFLQRPLYTRTAKAAGFRHEIASFAPHVFMSNLYGVADCFHLRDDCLDIVITGHQDRNAVTQLRLQTFRASLTSVNTET